MDHDLEPDDQPDSGEDHVGYGNPPKHTRWPRGYCPNSAGRPRKAKGRKPILERIAGELVEVKVGGKIRKMTRVEFLLMAVRNATANGNPAAQRLFDKLLNEVREEGPPIPKGVFITGEKLSTEEWEAEFGYLGGGPPPPPKPIQMAHVWPLLGKKHQPKGPYKGGGS